VTRARTVYFLAAPALRLVKIGIAVDLLKRVRGMALWSPVDLDLVAYCNGTPADERAVHYALRHAWSHFEWFYFSPEVAEFAEHLDEQAASELPRAPKRWTLPHQRPRGPKRPTCEVRA